MKKTFFLFSKGSIHFLESIDTGSIFSLGTEELKLLKNKDEEVIGFLRDNRIFKSVKTEDSFSAVLLVNDFCNLRCSYCFENGNFRHKSTMDDSLIMQISDLLKQNNDITFTGGEPLLSFNIIKSICDAVERKHFNAEYSLVTNGLSINDEMIEYMDKRSFRVQVSLDGTLAEDNNRPDRTNKAVENRILNNMIHALNVSDNITFTVRINFNKSSIPTFSQKMDYIIQTIAEYRDRISLDMKIVDLPVNSDEYVSLQEKYEVYETFYLYLLKNGIALPTSFVSGGSCMARNDNVILLDPEGRRYPCFSFVGNPDFIIDDSNVGFYKNVNCHSTNCDLYDLCMGGCLYENYCETGTMEKQCDYRLLLQLNKKLFVYKLIELELILAEEMEGVEHVQTFSIDI